MTLRKPIKGTELLLPLLSHVDQEKVVRLSKLKTRMFRAAEQLRLLEEELQPLVDSFPDSELASIFGFVYSAEFSAQEAADQLNRYLNQKLKKAREGIQ